MLEYWESLFKSEGAMWKFEPSDSALLALEIFNSKKIINILIPGVGYGRNAKVFYNNGFSLTGIEISESAINLAKINGLDFKIHYGSVTNMPFDDKKFDGIFCYALLHLLNKKERMNFLKSCYNQLKKDGLMIFVVVSKQASIYGMGKQLSKDRFKIMNGLNVYFYDSSSVEREFSHFELIEQRDLDEPIKHMIGEKPLKCIFVICKK